MSVVENDLLAEVRAARDAEKARTEHRKRVVELLIDLRRKRPELTIREIEDMIGRYYDRTTISRLTAEAVGRSRESAAA